MAQTLLKPIPSGNVRLLYVKSKVYIHPTKNTQDNVPGYLSLSQAASPAEEYLLSFSPEHALSQAEQAIYNGVDLGVSGGTLPVVSGAVGGSYAFSIPLKGLYLVQVRTPHLNLWYGSVVLHTQHDAEQLPILFFHDDESPSSRQSQSQRNKLFDPFAKALGRFHTSDLPWGGDELLNVLARYVVVEKSTLERSVFIINPTLADRTSFMPPVASPQTVGKTLNGMKWKVLEAFAALTTKAKTAVLDLNAAPLPAPIKNMLRRPEVASLAEDFDGARIYLAKWAMSIQEEALRLNEHAVLLVDSGADFAVSRRAPVSRVEWRTLFDASGRLRVTEHEVKEAVFHGSIADDVGLRGEVWLFLLEVYPWDSSSEERAVLLESYASAYADMKNRWELDEVGQQSDLFKDQMFRICKDVKRTDRNLAVFGEGGQEGDDVFDVGLGSLRELRDILVTYNVWNENLGYVQGMNDLLAVMYVVYGSAPSPCDNPQPSSGSDAASLHDASLGDASLHDASAPLGPSTVEVLAFWSFAKFMEIMERNFLRDQLGIKAQIETLNELLNLLLPEFHQHLIKCNASHLFFLFRMLLVWFKREFLLLDTVLPLWDVLFTRLYSSQYQLFVVLALLEKHQQIMMDFLTEDYEILRYINDLAMNEHDIDDILVRAERLFLRFRRVVYQADVRNGETEFMYLSEAELSALGLAGNEPNPESDVSTPEASGDEAEPRDSSAKEPTPDGPLEDTPSSSLSIVSANLRSLLRKAIVVQREVPRPEGVLGG